MRGLSWCACATGIALVLVTVRQFALNVRILYTYNNIIYIYENVANKGVRRVYSVTVYCDCAKVKVLFLLFHKNSNTLQQLSSSIMLRSLLCCWLLAVLLLGS